MTRAVARLRAVAELQATKRVMAGWRAAAEGSRWLVGMDMRFRQKADRTVMRRSAEVWVEAINIGRQCLLALDRKTSARALREALGSWRDTAATLRGLGRACRMIVGRQKIRWLSACVGRWAEACLADERAVRADVALVERWRRRAWRGMLADWREAAVQSSTCAGKVQRSLTKAKMRLLRECWRSVQASADEQKRGRQVMSRAVRRLEREWLDEAWSRWRGHGLRRRRRKTKLAAVLRRLERIRMVRGVIRWQLGLEELEATRQRSAGVKRLRAACKELGSVIEPLRTYAKDAAGWRSSVVRLAKKRAAVRAWSAWVGKRGEAARLGSLCSKARRRMVQGSARDAMVRWRQHADAIAALSARGRERVRRCLRALSEQVMVGWRDACDRARDAERRAGELYRRGWAAGLVAGAWHAMAARTACAHRMSRLERRVRSVCWRWRMRWTVGRLAGAAKDRAVLEQDVECQAKAGTLRERLRLWAQEAAQRRTLRRLGRRLSGLLGRRGSAAALCGWRGRAEEQRDVTRAVARFIASSLCMRLRHAIDSWFLFRLHRKDLCLKLIKFQSKALKWIVKRFFSMWKNQTEHFLTTKGYILYFSRFLSKFLVKRVLLSWCAAIGERHAFARAGSAFVVRQQSHTLSSSFKSWYEFASRRSLLQRLRHVVLSCSVLNQLPIHLILHSWSAYEVDNRLIQQRIDKSLAVICFSKFKKGIFDRWAALAEIEVSLDRYRSICAILLRQRADQSELLAVIETWATISRQDSSSQACSFESEVSVDHHIPKFHEHCAAVPKTSPHDSNSIPNTTAVAASLARLLLVSMHEVRVDLEGLLRLDEPQLESSLLVCCPNPVREVCREKEEQVSARDCALDTDTAGDYWRARYEQLRIGNIHLLEQLATARSENDRAITLIRDRAAAERSILEARLRALTEERSSLTAALQSDPASQAAALADLLHRKAFLTRYNEQLEEEVGQLRDNLARERGRLERAQAENLNLSGKTKVLERCLDALRSKNAGLFNQVQALETLVSARRRASTQRSAVSLSEDAAARTGGSGSGSEGYAQASPASPPVDAEALGIVPDSPCSAGSSEVPDDAQEESPSAVPSRLAKQLRPRPAKDFNPVAAKRLGPSAGGAQSPSRPQPGHQSPSLSGGSGRSKSSGGRPKPAKALSPPQSAGAGVSAPTALQAAVPNLWPFSW